MGRRAGVLLLCLGVAGCASAPALIPSPTPELASTPSPTTPVSAQVAGPTPIPSLSSASDRNTGMPAACDLLTSSEIEAAAGVTNSSSFPQPSGDYASACEVTSDTAQFGPVTILTLDAYDPATPDLLQRVSALGGEPLDLRDASGIRVPGQNGAIVIKNGRLVDIELGMALQGAEFRQAIATLAQLVADRMP